MSKKTSSHVPPWPQATRFSLTQFEAHVTRVCTVCTNSDSVTGYTYMCDILSRQNRQIPSTSSCLFNGFTVLAMKYVLELSLNSFSGVEISAACRCWPPIDCLLIVESLGNTTCVLRIIVLHEAILCATESFFNVGHSMFSRICVYKIPSIIWWNTQIRVAPLFDISAQTLTLTACFEAGLKIHSFLRSWHALFGCGILAKLSLHPSKLCCQQYPWCQYTSWQIHVTSLCRLQI